MAAPSTAALDTFNAGAAQNLTARAGWGAGVVYSGETTNITDAVPTFATPTAGFSSNVWGTAFLNSECWVLLGTVTGASQYLFTRLNNTGTGALNGYQAEFVGGNANLQSLTATIPTLLATAPQVVSAGDSMGLVSVGTTHQIWYKVGAGAWTLIVSANDATYTGSGSIGMDMQTTARVDTFGGGTQAPTGNPQGGKLLLLGVGA